MPVTAARLRRIFTALPITKANKIMKERLP
jgi:hypothetical protein